MDNAMGAVLTENASRAVFSHFFGMMKKNGKLRNNFAAGLPSWSEHGQSDFNTLKQERIAGICGMEPAPGVEGPPSIPDWAQAADRRS